MSASLTLRVAALIVPLVLFVRPAAASPPFPDVVREELALSSAPVCTLCHDNPNGGLGTATTPFAAYLRSRGLRAGDTASLRSALAAATAERHDSDGDGVPDVEQLKAGRDPNPSVSNVAPPEFGCGARVAPSTIPSSGNAVLLAAVGIGVVGLRRRRPGAARRPFESSL